MDADPGVPRRRADLDYGAVGRYVLGRRTPEGGYCFYRTPEWSVEEPNAPDTLAALESLKLLAIEAPEAGQTIEWLRGLQDGGDGYPSSRIGWAAVRALDVLGAEPDGSPDRWVWGWVRRRTGRGQLDNWREAIYDAFHLLELVRLRHGALHEQERRGIAALLDAARARSGGWARPGADLQTTAVAVGLAGLAGLPGLDATTAGEFLRHCEDGALGLRIVPRARATSAGALWGGLALSRALGMPLTYPDAVGESLALLQRADGGLGARPRAISTLQDTWRGLEAARLIDDEPSEEQP